MEGESKWRDGRKKHEEEEVLEEEEEEEEEEVVVVVVVEVVEEEVLEEKGHKGDEEHNVWKYIRNGKCFFSDVDECSLENVVTCDENAQCGNAVGGFTCSCATGYSGSGLTCGE